MTTYIRDADPVEFEVDIQSKVRYYALEQTLAGQVSQIAGRKGVSTETLLNLWVQEKVKEFLPELSMSA